MARSFAAFPLLVTAFWPVSAVAQADEPAGEPPQSAPGESEEIFVTARRTQESLQDVPVAVSAFSGAQLQERSVDTLDQIARYTPNLRFDGAAALSGGNYNATVFIRGVGQNDFAIFSDPGVGFYVDGVYYARSIGGVMDAIDLENVQVLRGPQGTLFGKNTIGGAVLITTGTPDPDAFSGRVDATYGRFDRMDLRGYVNVPIAQGVAALRLSAATLNRDGYVRRLVDGTSLGDRNSDTFRARLRIQPTSALTIDLGGDYTRARENSAPNDLLAVANVPGITGIPFLANYNAFVAPTLGIIAPNGQPTLNPSFITDSPFETYATGENRNDLDLWGLQGTISYDFGGAELRSITAYRELDAYFARDGDNTPFTFRETVNDDEQWQFSQEVQLTGALFGGRLRYVLGGYYFEEEASDIARADLALGLQPPLAPPPPTPAVFITNLTDNRSWAVFGEFELELIDNLYVIAGGRYSDDRKIFTSINVRQRDNVEFINVTVSESWSDFTPRFGLRYEPTPDLMLYGTYSEGYKQGGFNGRPLVGPQEVTAYRPETLETFEVGVKSQWLDRRLTANLALFHSRYKDIQLTVNDTPRNFVDNAAAAEINGFELELLARPARWFNANAAVGYTDAQYTEIGSGTFPSATLPITLDSHLVKVPRWTVNVGAEVRHEFGDGSELRLRGDLSMYSRIFNDVANTPIITEDGYEVVNARLTYAFPGDRFEIAAFVTNLTDTLYFVSGNVSGAFGLAEASYGRPREWGVTAGFRF